MSSNFAVKSAIKSSFLKKYYLLPSIIIYATVYACSLSFVYIEGDDASSVAFHAMGRNSSLQMPYSSYHGMMDIFLLWLPANEVFVRYAAVTISAISAVLFSILIIKLLIDLVFEGDYSNAVWMAIFIPLISPELFYLGLVYTPSVTAMCFILTAHLLIRYSQRRFIKFSKQDSWSITIFFLSALLFGIGVACRWDIGTYLILIMGDLFLNSNNGKPFNQFSRVIFLKHICWFLLAVCFSILAISISGYGLAEIYDTLILADREVAEAKPWFSTVGAFQTLFTPAFIISFLLGIGLFIRSNKKFVVLALIGLIPVLPYFLSREPKMILPALPGLFLAVGAGINLIWFGMASNKYSSAIKILFVLLVAAPWFVGLKVYSGETAWGPGFEIREGKTSAISLKSRNLVSSRFEERSISIKNLELVLGSGFAVPTPEGPRPLGGHAFVLINQEWRDLAEKLNAERQSVIDLAVSTQLTVLQDGGNSYLVSKLLENNFQTSDSATDFQQNDINERIFFKTNGEQVKIQTLRRTNSLLESKMLLELIKTNPNGRVILFCNSSTFQKINKIEPESFQPIGAFSAILNITAISEKVLEK